MGRKRPFKEYPKAFKYRASGGLPHYWVIAEEGGFGRSYWHRNNEPCDNSPCGLITEDRFLHNTDWEPFIVGQETSS